jgi:hypothetical protein
MKTIFLVVFAFLISSKMAIAAEQRELPFATAMMESTVKISTPTIPLGTGFIIGKSDTASKPKEGSNERNYFYVPHPNSPHSDRIESDQIDSFRF